MNRRVIRAVLIGSVATAATACMAASDGQSPAAAAQVIFSASMCGDTSRGPQVTWLDSAPALQAVYDRIHRHQVGGDDRPPASVDFSSRAVLWVQMGMQPSAGYGLRLQDPGAGIGADTLTLHVSWLEPAPGRLYAQVVTHPCLLVTVPKAGYRRIQVRDQHGALRMQTEISR